MSTSGIRYTISTSENLVRACGEGELTFDDFNTHTTELIQHPDFTPGVRAIYDFTQLDRIVGDPAVFEQVSAQITELGDAPEPIRIALVTGGNPVLEGTFRGWKIMMSFSSVHYETFENIEDAERWVRETDDS